MQTKTYYFRLKAISPIHIGCGEVYEPTGFAIDEEKNELISFEPASFLGKLEQNDLDRYSAICKKGTVDSLLEIYKFIRQHKEQAEGRRVDVSDAFVYHYNKVLKIQPGKTNNEFHNFKIDRTAFQPLYAVPYIPGSAIKGAIRTAVLNLRAKDKEHKYAKFRNGQDLNDKLSGGTFATDPFRLLKVGDFQAAGEVSQRIVYAVNKKKKPAQKEAGGPYQILEVVTEGSEFVGTITLQQPPPEVNIKQALTLAEIEQALLGFYNCEQKNEQSVLQGIGCDMKIFSAIAPQIPLIRIGRHSGAECVTVEGHRNIRIQKGPKPAKHEEHATTVWLAAGSEKPVVNKHLKPFGWLMLSILSAAESHKFVENRADIFTAWEADQQQAIAAHREWKQMLASRRKAEESEQQRLAAEQQEQEEQLRKFPWRAILPQIKQIEDWGALKTQILEHGNFLKYQAEEEIGLAVMETSRRVAEKNIKKWDISRDLQLAAWLEPSGVNWTHYSPPVADNVLLTQLRSFKTPADYDRSLDITGLDMESCRILSPLFKKWKWDKKGKAKAGNHTLWKNLQRRIKQL